MKQSRNLTTEVLGNTVETNLRTGYNMQAVPRLIVDWNLNRYTTPTAVNTPNDQDEGFDIENFPIESIIEPLRPSKGIIKARVGEAVVSNRYQIPTEPKFYVADEKDKYKYWTSPYRTNGSGVFPNHTDAVTSARPSVTYGQVLNCNKIVIRFENTWATPNAYGVHIKTSVAGAYGSAIGRASPAMNETTGVLTLYYNGSAWVTTRPATLVATSVAAIELRVTTMKAGKTAQGTTMSYYKRSAGPITSFTSPTNTNGANSSLNVISMEAHYEADLSNRLISVEDNFEMSETSQLYPVGTITSNTASLLLSNEDGVFNRENVASPYYGLLEPNANVTLEYIYTISGVNHSVQQLNMYSNGWSGSGGTVSLELEDASKYLKEIKPRAIFYQGKAVTEVIWRLLDSVGFTDYEISFEDTVVEHEIPFFWTTGEETIWEVLDEIAQATQTAIYFDGNGKLQVRTRNAAFRDAAPSVNWNLLGQNVGANLADIVNDGLQVSDEFEANNIDVKYKTTKWKVGTSGKPALSAVWEPEAENVVVRSSPLIRDIGLTSNFIFVDQKELKLWPFKSKVQIDGEIIQYEGKQFVYYTGSGPYIKNTVVVKSEDEFKTYNNKTIASYRKNNHYTGGLAITEREVWNTTKATHLVDVNGWTSKFAITGSYWNSPSGFKHQKAESIVTINTPSQMNTAADTMWVHRGPSGASTGYKMYGTRIRFNKDKASPTQRAGIGFWQNASEQGYYVEVTLTNLLDGAKDRKTRGEVTIYSRKGTDYKVVAKGQPVAIAPGIWYDLDVSVSHSGQTHIRAWLNGTIVADGTTDANTVQTETGKFSMYARGRTNVSFEYFYGVNNVSDPPDDFGYYDLQYGGVRGNLFIREYVWEILTRRKKIKKKKWVKEKYRHSQFFFDEFGPYVHEVREFDVKFDPNPVQYSRLFSTNEWYSAILEYTSDSFGARFVVANMSRNHAILKGEDRLIYGGGAAAVNQVFTVLGRDLQISDEETVNKKNTAAIRARGQIDTELSSDWIQSKAMANDIATWIASHWSAGIDEITVDIFGNPLIEIGDVVDVDYDLQHMAPGTHKYFVTSVSNTFETGISTTLTLRRVRTTAPAALT